MRFSIAAASIFVFACLSSVKAQDSNQDSYAAAIAKFCDGNSIRFF